MRNTEISALIVFVVTLFMFLMAKAAFTASDEATCLVWTVAMSAWLFHVWLTSFYVIPDDKMLASFFIGTLGTTFITKQYAMTEKKMGGRTVRMTDPVMNGGRGLFGTGVVILLFPIWRGVFFPTTAIKLSLHATTVYLKEVKVTEGAEEIIKSPGVPVQVDVTILLKLTPALGTFVQTINVLSRKEYDLAKDSQVYDNLWQASDEKNDQYTYRAPLITQIVLDALSETVLHSIRSVAGEHYTWKQVGSEDDDEEATRDLKGSIPHFQDKVVKELAKSDSIFCEAGLLKESDEPEDYFGRAASFFSLRVERIVPEDAQFSAALAKPMIADLEADASKLKGEGLSKEAEAAGLTPEMILQANTLEKIESVRMVNVGGGVIDIARSLFSSRDDESERPQQGGA